MKELIISQAGEQVTVMLSPQEGEQVRQILEQNIDRSFVPYLDTVGLLPNNVYPMLTGRRKISLKALRKLLSNSPLEVECRVEIIVKKASGDHAPPVPSLSLEEALYFEEEDGSVPDQ